VVMVAADLDPAKLVRGADLVPAMVQVLEVVEVGTALVADLAPVEDLGTALVEDLAPAKDLARAEPAQVNMATAGTGPEVRAEAVRRERDRAPGILSVAAAAVRRSTTTPVASGSTREVRVVRLPGQVARVGAQERERRLVLRAVLQESDLAAVLEPEAAEVALPAVRLGTLSVAAAAVPHSTTIRVVSG
jgi:hypothetical protein